MIVLSVKISIQKVLFTPNSAWGVARLFLIVHAEGGIERRRRVRRGDLGSRLPSPPPPPPLEHVPLRNMRQAWRQQYA